MIHWQTVALVAACAFVGTYIADVTFRHFLTKRHDANLPSVEHAIVAMWTSAVASVVTPIIYGGW